MPPKKMKFDPKQKTLDILFNDLNSTDKQNLVSSSDVQDENACSASSIIHKVPKIRQFQPKWLKTYSWLRYDNGGANKNEDFMFCEICTDNKKVNGMNKIAKNRNFQNSTLTRHADLADHKLCLIAPELRTNFEKCSAKLTSDQDKAITVLLKVVKWMADEDIPLNKFKSFVNLLHELGVQDLDVLRKSNINYESSVTASELLESLAEFANNAVTITMKKSPVVTLLADESNDISNRKRLVMYAQTLSEDLMPVSLCVQC
ncbi:hypothetical protein ACJMK2_032124 [Sinanodonta woodiana]|uniref:C17orf113 probable zinc finger domain-containing protein n=1 Tax=Sinanodonta woodiana TaxID=1069815 RepID=A0ABD3X0X0_SINWO